MDTEQEIEEIKTLCHRARVNFWEKGLIFLGFRMMIGVCERAKKAMIDPRTLALYYQITANMAIICGSPGMALGYAKKSYKLCKDEKSKAIVQEVIDMAKAEIESLRKINLQ